jgi:hypothetical protein
MTSLLFSNKPLKKFISKQISPNALFLQNGFIFA